MVAGAFDVGGAQGVGFIGAVLEFGGDGKAASAASGVRVARSSCPIAWSSLAPGMAVQIRRAL